MALVSVLFVCMGNICRSPTAEGVFRQVVAARGLEDAILIDSAGTGAWHVGEPPDRRAQDAARKRGYDLSALRARQVSPRDCQDFDYILTMDMHNLRMVQQLCRHPKARIQPFLNFALQLKRAEVPDPYSGGVEGFELVLDLIEVASEGLLERLLKTHQLNDGDR